VLFITWYPEKKKISVRLSSPTLNNRSGVALAYPLFFNTAWIVSSSTSSCLLHHHVIRLIFYEDLWPGLCFSTRWELPLAKASVAVPPRPGCCLWIKIERCRWSSSTASLILHRDLRVYWIGPRLLHHWVRRMIFIVISTVSSGSRYENRDLLWLARSEIELACLAWLSSARWSQLALLGSGSSRLISWAGSI
jgi:hypothetical protein